MSRPLRVLFLTGNRGGATLRYRVRLPQEALQSAGIRVVAVQAHSPVMRDWAAEADVVTIYRAPASEQLLDLVDYCADRAIPTTYDIDDRVFLPHHLDDLPFLEALPPNARHNFVTDVPQTGLVVPAVQRLSASTAPLLAEMVAAGAPGAASEVLPNGIGRALARFADAAVRPVRTDGRIRIAYFSGSATHDEDWAEAEPALQRVLEDFPQTELWVVGSVALSCEWSRFGARVVRISSVPWTELPDLLAAIDINLAPLASSPFTESKSAIKWLEAAMVSTPTVASATQPFQEAVTDGAGLLVSHGGDWYEPVAKLVIDAALRSDIGAEARAAAYRGFGPDVQSARLARYYRAASKDAVDPAAVRAETARVRATALLSDSPTSKLEKYPFDPELVGRTFNRGSATHGRRRLGRLVPTGGPIGLMRPR